VRTIFAESAFSSEIPATGVEEGSLMPGPDGRVSGEEWIELADLEAALEAPTESE
jgi:hypothetical protein